MAQEVFGPLSKAVRVAQAVTTDTTSATFRLPSGVKSFYGEVAGTGAVTQTQALYGTVYPTAINGVLLGTLTLSGTTRDQAALPPITACFPYYYLITTSTSGTNATGNVWGMY